MPNLSHLTSAALSLGALGILGPFCLPLVVSAEGYVLTGQVVAETATLFRRRQYLSRPLPNSGTDIAWISERNPNGIKPLFTIDEATMAVGGAVVVCIPDEEQPGAPRARRTRYFERMPEVNEGSQADDVFKGRARAAQLPYPPLRLVNGEFVDAVYVLPRGIPLVVRNEDPFRYLLSVTSSPLKRQYIDIVAGASDGIETHDKESGIIDVACYLHSWLHALVYVVDADVFAATGPKGRFELNVPDGRPYRVEFWVGDRRFDRDGKKLSRSRQVSPLIRTKGRLDLGTIRLRSE